MYCHFVDDIQYYFYVDYCAISFLWIARNTIFISITAQSHFVDNVQHYFHSNYRPMVHNIMIFPHPILNQNQKIVLVLPKIMENLQQIQTSFLRNNSNGGAGCP